MRNNAISERIVIAESLRNSDRHRPRRKERKPPYVFSMSRHRAYTVSDYGYAFAAFEWQWHGFMRGTDSAREARANYESAVIAHKTSEHD